jgi:transcription initiation factor IIE alpha subunit
MRPEYLICLECDTPIYVFEWEEDHPVEVLCPICGNDDLEQFMNEDALEELTSAADTKGAKT